eukprot:403363058
MKNFKQIDPSELQISSHISLPTGQFQVLFEGMKPVFINKALQLNRQKVIEYFAKEGIDIESFLNPNLSKKARTSLSKKKTNLQDMQQEPVAPVDLERQIHQIGMDQNRVNVNEGQTSKRKKSYTKSDQQNSSSLQQQQQFQQAMPQEKLDQMLQKQKKALKGKKRQKRFQEAEPIQANSTVTQSSSIQPDNSQENMSLETSDLTENSNRYSSRFTDRDSSRFDRQSRESKIKSIRDSDRKVYFNTESAQADKNCWLLTQQSQRLQQKLQDPTQSSPDLSIKDLNSQYKQDQVLMKLQAKQLEKELELKNKRKEELRNHISQIEKELCESDNEYAYPTLTKLPGSPFAQIPKKILAVAFDHQSANKLLNQVSTLKLNQDIQGSASSDAISQDQMSASQISQLSLYYLCSWIQDYQGTFYTPSLVPSLILQTLDQEDLIVKFYEKQHKAQRLKMSMAFEEHQNDFVNANHLNEHISSSRMNDRAESYRNGDISGCDEAQDGANF